MNEDLKRQLGIELQELLRQKGLLESMIAHVEALIGTFSELSSDESIPRKGLRALVQEVLVNHPNGLRASEVVIQLTQRGFTPSGKSTLRTLVSSELSRMKRQGKVRRDRGRYFTTEEEMEGPNWEQP